MNNIEIRLTSSNIMNQRLCMLQVYLVENKEESLVRARDRIQQLGLTNVVSYQVRICCLLEVGVPFIWP